MQTSMRELRSLLDEIATIDWRHPSWWALVAATTLFERWPARSGRDLDADYLSSDGGPRSDTFMATPSRGLDAAVAVASAVAMARSAWDALVDLDGTLPGQPLLQELARRSSVIRRRALGRSRRVVFATPVGLYLATLGADPGSDGELVAQLAALCAEQGGAPHRLTRVYPHQDELLEAAVAVSLWREDLESARHAHRRAWNRAGGPWLGVARTADLALVTTSHTVVDGYGHALIAARVLATPVPVTLIALARRYLGESQLVCAPVQAGACPLGIATGELGEPARFVELLYATGWALERMHRRELSPSQRRNERFTPTMQIPIAPGHRSDPARFRRRVAPGIVALAMHRGVLEHPKVLSARLGELIAREGACAGVLGRVRTAALRLPLPIFVKRRSVGAGVVPHPLVPGIEVLAGRGCLSSLVFAAHERPEIPLYAGSAPALDPSIEDPRGGSVVTVVQGSDQVTVTVSGTGLAGTEAGARSFLVEWERGLARARALTAKAYEFPEAG